MNERFALRNGDRVYVYYRGEFPYHGPGIFEAVAVDSDDSNYECPTPHELTALVSVSGQPCAFPLSTVRKMVFHKKK